MSPEAEWALMGLGAGIGAFVLLVWFPWFVLQRRARKKAVKDLQGLPTDGSPPATAGEAGRLLYEALGDLATVDYEKHRDVQLGVARVLQRAAAGPGYHGSRNDE